LASRDSSSRRSRRSLSTVRSDAPVETGGEPTAARALDDALRAPAAEPDATASLTHPVHTYPARMHPATAERLLELVAEPGRTVLDPFCGAGTVLVEACRQGIAAIGVDINPLAVAIAQAKTWLPPAGRRRALVEAARQIAGAAWAEGKAARRSGHTGRGHRGPQGAAGRARDKKIGPWFAPHVRRELEFLASEIDRVRARDDELAGHLTVLLSAILYKVSRRASDTDPRRVDRNVGRGAAGRLFRQRAEMLVAGLDELAAGNPPMPEVRLGDARHLGEVGIGRSSIDAVVTSPPYAGTYDYADQHQLRLDFLGISDRRFRSREIGSRRGFRREAGGRAGALRRWNKDLGAVLGEIGRALRHGGRAAVVLGDSLAGGAAIRADEVLTTCLPDKLAVVAWASQPRPELGGAERRAFAGRPKREHIFLLEAV
jgi:SAM-dependent methyltransferase